MIDSGNARQQEVDFFAFLVSCLQNVSGARNSHLTCLINLRLKVRSFYAPSLHQCSFFRVVVVIPGNRTRDLPHLSLIHI